MLRLSVLDQSPISEGSTGSQALHNTIDLARLTDRLGYHRYWVAEHHGGTMLAGPSPEVLIGPIAANTQRIRVGSGGVMLPHYSPLKVAESFSVLAGLFPERIDLGLGRAAGTDPLTTYALQRDRRSAAPDDFPDQLVELLAYLNGTFPDGHRFARLADLPGRPEAPEPWLLGSSPQSAVWAAQLGLPYAFADFISPEGAAIAASYQAAFQHSERHMAPQTVGRRVDPGRRQRGGGAAAGELGADGLQDAPARAADPRAAAREGGALPGVRGRAARRTTPRPTHDRGRDRQGPRPGRAAGRRLPGRRGDRGHDHPRPRGAAALL